MKSKFRIPIAVLGAILISICSQPARADALPEPLPAPQYFVQASTGFCAGFNCDTPYNKFLRAAAPATLQVGCSADVGAPNCAGSQLSVAPAPFLSVAASTSLNHTDQMSGAVVNVTYDYEILCPTCSPGTLVPLSIGGTMEAHYVQGTVPPNGTVGFQDLDRIFVNGFDTVKSGDNLVVFFANEGLHPSSSTGTAPNGFGFCESTWKGFNSCTGGPANSYEVQFEARVNEAYPIFLDATAGVHAINTPFSTSSAEATNDPVLSFAPGFDSTGYSIAVSPGVGNQASTVPEPATWMLLSTAALAWIAGHRLRRMIRRSF